VTAQELYDECLKNGCSPRMAEMFAMRQPPASARGDRELFRDGNTVAKQHALNPTLTDAIIKRAVKHGYRPNANDIYDPGLARFDGDPRAFIPPCGGKSHMREVLEKDGYEVVNAPDDSGNILNVKYRPREPKKPVALAPDLAREMVRKETAANPELARKSKRELTEMVTDKYGSK
jgi:hypothetical protein